MKKKCLIAILAAACVLMSSCALMLSPPRTSSSSSSEAASQVVSEASPSGETSSVVSEEPAPSALAVGDSCTIGDFEITVSEFKIQRQIENTYGYFEADEGNQYLVVSFSATNNGKQAGTLFPSFSLGDDPSATILYGDGYEYSPTGLLGYDDDLHDEVVNPLSSVTGILAFELPDAVVNGTDPLTLQISAGSSSSAEYQLR